MIFAMEHDDGTISIPIHNKDGFIVAADRYDMNSHTRVQSWDSDESTFDPADEPWEDSEAYSDLYPEQFEEYDHLAFGILHRHD